MANEHDAGVDDGPVLAKNCTVDTVVAVLLFIFGAVVMFQSWELGSGWTSDGPGAGYFPFYMGLIICLSSVGVFYEAIRGKTRDTGAFVDRGQFKRVLAVLLPAIVYVFLVVFIGLYVASAIYIAVFMVILGKYSIWKSVLIGVLTNALFFAMFEIWFKVPLYKGTLDPLAFLGY